MQARDCIFSVGWEQKIADFLRVGTPEWMLSFTSRGIGGSMDFSTNPWIFFGELPRHALLHSEMGGVKLRVRAQQTLRNSGEKIER